MAIRFTVNRHSYLKGDKMKLPQIWKETLKRLDDLESRVGRIELVEDFTMHQNPKSEPKPEPETKSDLEH